MNDKTPQSPVHTGRQYWQSLNELAETPAVRAAIENEFPTYQPGTMLSSQSRRHFLKLAGASMALAGITVTGCRRWPKENVVEQTSRPIGRTPGIPERYASAFELGGYAQPLLVTTFDGRPIKIEGNPLHPQCKTFGGKLGASTLIAQATLLEMYDPERSRAIVKKGSTAREASTWQGFTEFASQHFAKLKGADSGKIAILTEQTSSPTFAAQLAAFKKAFPNVKVYEYEPISRDNELTASKLAFSAAYRQIYNIAAADVVVSFDADLLGQHPDALRHANEWSSRRRTADADKTMNRLYQIESRYSTTGTIADERVPAKIRLIEELILQLAFKAGLESGRSLAASEIAFIDALWADISTKTGKVIVAGGYHLRPEILGVIAKINDTLGAFGSTITVLPDTDRPTHAESIKTLVDAMNAKSIDTLIMLGGNPVYDAPTDLNFNAGLAAVPTSIHLSLYFNETSQQSTWHVNRAHYLESWGDSVAYDGTICLQQPMIEPLFAGKTPAELLAVIAGDTNATSQSVFYGTWAARLNDKNVANSKALRKALHDGFVEGSAPATKLSVQSPKVNIEPANTDEAFELRFVADYKMYDGRFINNGWLMEVPDPVSKVSWDNVAYISYADAIKLGVEQRDHTIDLITIKLGSKALTIPGYILPGQPQGVITLPLGWARKIAGAQLLSDRFGSIGSGVGYDTYSLRTSSTMYVAYGALAERAGGTADVATTQAHHIIEPVGFDVREKRIGEKSKPGLIVHESTLKAFVENPGAPHSKAHKLLPLQLFPEPYKPGAKTEGGPDAFNNPHAWGMSIDMNSCIGCNACVMACVAENNIPVVGRDQVIMNREMHWLRIDRYYKGPIDDPNPQVTFQPMMCVHCENAPCEEVCPVAATVHDTEGLNTMVYNRCIGTRYCSNNCPYKVRRFNYLDYQSRVPGDFPTPWLGIPDTQQQQSIDKIKAMVFNPEVTVRMRGVMEKCTYCTQRIKSATIDRRNEWAQGQREKPTVDDFDVVTACQQACPTEAIVFGDLNDSESLVSKLHKNQRAYAVLEELNNRPRTKHMAKLRNPTKEPEAAAEKEH